METENEKVLVIDYLRNGEIPVINDYLSKNNKYEYIFVNIIEKQEVIDDFLHIPERIKCVIIFECPTDKVENIRFFIRNCQVVFVPDSIKLYRIHYYFPQDRVYGNKFFCELKKVIGAGDYYFEEYGKQMSDYAKYNIFTGWNDTKFYMYKRTFE